MMSEIDVGTIRRVCKVSAPLDRMASMSEMMIIAKALSCESQATVMAVKPLPAATVSDRVMFAPEATMKPTRPQIAPERNMVRIMMRPTFMPA